MAHITLAAADLHTLAITPSYRDQYDVEIRSCARGKRTCIADSEKAAFDNIKTIRVPSRPSSTFSHSRHQALSILLPLEPHIRPESHPQSSNMGTGQNTKALPPVELAFPNWITDATSVVKSTPTPLLIDAVATKKTKGTATVLEIVARFGVADDGTATVTGSTADDKSKFKVSDPDDLPPPPGSKIGGPIKDPQKLKNGPWDIWASNKQLLNYSSFKLFRLDSSRFQQPKKPADVPYYEFFDNTKNSMGIFAATDGKELK